MPNHPSEHTRVLPNAPARVEGLEEPELLRLTRRSLLSIYSPQQAAIWLGAHAAGDPVEVAHKARRLCGVDDRAAPLVCPGQAPVAHAPIRTAELTVVGRGLVGNHELVRVLHRLVDDARSAITNASTVTMTFSRRLAPELLHIGHGRAFDPVAMASLDAGQGREVLLGRLVETSAPDEDQLGSGASRHGPGADGRLILAPIIEHRQVIGALQVRAEGPQAFAPTDRVLTAILAAYAGMAIRAARTDLEPTMADVDHELQQRVEALLMARHGDTVKATDLPHAVRMASQRLLETGGATVAREHRIRVEGGAGPDSGSTPHVYELLLTAVRDIFTAEQPDEIQTVLLETVTKLGASISRAADAEGPSVPVDLSVNLGEPLLATLPTDPAEVSEHLHAHLPRLVEDARRAVERLARQGRLAADAEHDVLTGLFNRRAYERFIGRLQPGDVFVLLDLDDFKHVNDTHGHLVGDQVLRVFGSVLRDHMRITEHAIRLGGDEFLIILEDPGSDGADLLLERLSVAWRQRRPVPVSFSYGIATVSSGADAALEHADRSLYDQKHARARADRARRGGRCE